MYVYRVLGLGSPFTAKMFNFIKGSTEETEFNKQVSIELRNKFPGTKLSECYAIDRDLGLIDLDINESDIYPVDAIIVEKVEEKLELTLISVFVENMKIYITEDELINSGLLTFHECCK